MQAINYYLIIENIKEAPKQIGGLDILDSQNTELRYLKGKILSVGDLVPDVLKVGDIIRYDKHAGHTIPIDDQLLYVIKVGDIICKL
jgi:co-chaperonin GroES (HSP10)